LKRADFENRHINVFAEASVEVADRKSACASKNAANKVANRRKNVMKIIFLI